MNVNKANTRDKKYRKNRYGMAIDNKSIFVIQEAIIKRANKNKNRKNGRHYVIKGE